LALACVNLASLLVVRSIAREKEIAVRLSLGATRSRLSRQFLTETFLLAALGGTCGLLLAPWAAGLLVASHPDPLGIDTSLDIRAFMFGLATSVLTGLLVGLSPIVASRRVGLAQAGSAPSAGRGTHRRLNAHDVIVTCQIAMSLAMLISAALLVQSLRNLSAVEVGVRADDLLLIAVDPRAAGYDGQRVAGFWRDTLARVSQIHGVEGVSVARTVPLAPGRQRQPLIHPTSGERIEIDINAVGPGYFRTLGIPLLGGQEFDERDGETSRPVVIVNERLAQLFWPGEDPIGKRLQTGRRPGSPAPEVVGVVKDVRYRNLRDEAGPMFYVPVFQSTSTDAMTLHVRTASDPGVLAGTIRREMQSLDANVPLYGIRTLEDQLSAPLAQPRQAAALSSGFGLLALVLSGIGVYGVTALAVRRQTRDIGIRMALGAQPRQIVRLMGRRGLTLVVAGLGLGLAGSFGVTQIAGAFLYGIAPSDTTTFARMAVLLAVVSAAAVYIPARAATRLDAVAAIRDD
jgi:predicted permease